MGISAPRVSVIVPTLNEERNLPYFFSRLPRRRIAELILVDGGSTDRTVPVARALCPELVVIPQSRTGKGNALACGFAVATGDIVVMIDADGSTDPAEIPRFVAALLAGADYAKGSRFLPGGGSDDITRLRKVGNGGLSGMVNLLFGTRFTDLCYGYNAFWRRALPHLELPPPALPAPADGGKLWGDGFEVETLISIRAATRGLRIEEVASMESRRLHGVSNLNALPDGVRVLRIILRELRRSRGTPAVATPAAPAPAPAPRPSGEPTATAEEGARWSPASAS